MGCVGRVSLPLHVELSLSVAYSNKQRLVVIACGQIYPYLQQRKVKLDYLDDVVALINPNSWFNVDDLDSG